MVGFRRTTGTVTCRTPRLAFGDATCPLQPLCWSSRQLRRQLGAMACPKFARAELCGHYCPCREMVWRPIDLAPPVALACAGRAAREQHVSFRCICVVPRPRPQPRLRDSQQGELWSLGHKFGSVTPKRLAPLAFPHRWSVPRSIPICRACGLKKKTGASLGTRHAPPRRTRGKPPRVCPRADRTVRSSLYRVRWFCHAPGPLAGLLAVAMH